MVHHYWARFLLVKNKIIDCHDEEIIESFRFICRDAGILNALARRRVQSFAELSDMVRKYCAMESTWRLQQMRREPVPAPRPRKAQAKRAYARGSPEREPAEKRNKPRTVLDELLDKPCPIHSALLNTNPTHRLRACWVVRQVAKSAEAILRLQPASRRPETPSFGDNNVLTIYETFSSDNLRKKALRELSQVHQVTAVSSWTDTPITFNEEDEPRARPIRAPAALVLDPIMDSFRLTKSSRCDTRT
jgi:hypothetical protein